MHIVIGIIGLALWGVCFHYLRTGLAMETSIASEYAPPGFESVANLQLMHTQELMVQIGLGAGVAGTILVATSLIIWAMPRS